MERVTCRAHQTTSNFKHRKAIGETARRVGYDHLEGASKSNFCPFPALSPLALRPGANTVGVKVNHGAASQGHDPAQASLTL